MPQLNGPSISSLIEILKQASEENARIKKAGRSQTDVVNNNCPGENIKPSAKPKYKKMILFFNKPQ